MPDALVYYRRKLLDQSLESSIINADGDTLENDLILSAGENNLVLQVTSEQYQNLLSASINGCFTTFPSNPIGVLYPLIKAGKLSFCTQLLDCIENDPDVYNAIANIAGVPTFSESVSNGQSFNTVDLSDATNINPTCDLDILYGQCNQLVRYLDAINTDILEVIEVATNIIDATADVVGDITFVDESSVDAVLSYIQFLQDNIAENYTAQVTETYLTDCACGLFCYVQDNDCELTPDILFQYWSDRLTSGLSITGLIFNTWAYIVGGTWIGTEIADVMFLGQLALRSQLGRVLNFSAYFDIQSRIVMYSNDPDNDWETVCDDCHPICTLPITIDWTPTLLPECVSYVGNNDYRDISEGNPSPSDFYQSGGSVTGYHAVGIQVDIDESTNTVYIQSDHYGIVSSSAVYGVAYHYYYDSIGTLVHSESFNITSSGTWLTKNSNYTHSEDIKSVRVFTAYSSGGTPRNITQGLDNVIVSTS